MSEDSRESQKEVPSKFSWKVIDDLSMAYFRGAQGLPTGWEGVREPLAGEDTVVIRIKYSFQGSRVWQERGGGS